MKKLILIVILILGINAIELAVTEDYLEELQKTVSWEVTNYEENIFRGWTLDEVRGILTPLDYGDDVTPIKGVSVTLDDSEEPKSVSWKGSKCVHEVRDQEQCGSCWAFSATGVASDRCCLHSQDHGWLAVQELVSCDIINNGCSGGLEYFAFEYVQAHGLVHENCFPYVAANVACPKQCEDGKDWENSHVCKCEYRIDCQGAKEMQKCLQSGPVTAGMIIYKDFISYKSGIYYWSGKGDRLGQHAIRCIGYSTIPEPHYECINSWGTTWGNKGYFRIGVGEVGIDTRNPSYPLYGDP